MSDQQSESPPVDVGGQLGPASQQRRIQDVSMMELLTLEPHGVDTYLGIAPEYPMPRIFGGQVVAQALRAAQHSVEPEFSVHSLHAYFIRAGTSKEPIRYEVERIRNGRSFRTRRVVARQSSGAILNLSASFQRVEEAPDVQAVSMPTGIGRPEDGEATGWGNGLINRHHVTTDAAHYVAWLRLGGSSSGDGAIDQCALAFLTDSMPGGSVRAGHPLQLPPEEARRVLTSASLDNAVYFHRPADPFCWLLADARCHSLVGGRGVAVVDVFDEDGAHALTVIQEVLIRERANKPKD